MSDRPRAERPRLKVRYDTEVRGRLKEELGLPNVMEVPRLEKIVVNMGVGRATQQQSLLEGAERDLTAITGQKPVVTRAKKSIAGFKLREGNAIGAKVTLRGDRVWEFLDRLDQPGHPPHPRLPGPFTKAFDGRGNYTFGVTEQLIFPEIDYDKIDAPRGMDITIVTTARTNDEGRALLTRSASRSDRRLEQSTMAKKALDQKQQRKPEVQGSGLHPVPPVWPAEAVYRKFGLCRICLRTMVHAGEVPGVTKASW